jgi:hypothetical protein
MAHPGGRPLKYTNIEDMQKDIDAYFQDCQDNKRPLTVTGLAYALDMDTHSIRNYEERDQFFTAIQKARMRILMQKEELLSSKTTQVAGLIFDLKNNYSGLYKDKTEQEVTGNQNINVTIIRK